MKLEPCCIEFLMRLCEGLGAFFEQENTEPGELPSVTLPHEAVFGGKDDGIIVCDCGHEIRYYLRPAK